MTASHAYGGVGTYIVTLTVGDGSDIDQATQTIQCKLRGKTVRCS